MLAEDEEASKNDIVFWLLKEAVRTERAIAPPGPRGYISSMPEAYHTNNEIFAVEVEMIADSIYYPPRIKPVATSAAAERYMEVMKWLRFVRGRNRSDSKALLWLMAQDAPAGYIGRVTPYRTKSAQRAAKHRRLNEIVKRLDEEDVFGDKAKSEAARRMAERVFK